MCPMSFQFKVKKNKADKFLECVCKVMQFLITSNLKRRAYGLRGKYSHKYLINHG